MNYEICLQYLYEKLPMFQRIGAAAYKADLSNTIALARALGHPENKFKSIHVAGTNGKGSVSHMLASIYQEAGYKTALYTSPHLLDFRERIRINGKMISKEEVVSFVNNQQQLIEEIKPSFFEITMIMAFDYFARESVDIAIIETGLGGRLDSTNIIMPLASVITNISLEHEKFLGNSMASIAKEKAGIIKKNRPVIIGQKTEDTSAVFQTKAEEEEAPLYYSSMHYQLQDVVRMDDSLKIRVKHLNRQSVESYVCDLAGRYQGENLCTVLTCVEHLQEEMPVDEECIRKAVGKIRQNTSIRGRWDVIEIKPWLVCDISHNPEAISNMLMQLEEYRYAALHVVLGLSDDKNIEGILKQFPSKANYYFVKPDVPRGMDAAELASEASRFGLMGLSYSKLTDALEVARSKADRDDFILITGSAFVVADALKVLDQSMPA
jgi:dihydrofolate synthase/folylpolyglutamate synthase